MTSISSPPNAQKVPFTISTPPSSSSFVRLPPSLLNTFLTNPTADPNLSSSFIPLRLQSPSSPSTYFYTSFNGGILDTSESSIQIPDFIASALHLTSPLPPSPSTSFISVVAIPMPRVADQVTFTPLSVEDWEMIEVNVEFLESKLLSLFSVVFANQEVSVSLPGNFEVKVRVADLGFGKSSDPCLRLLADTEVIVQPFPRKVDPLTHDASGPLRLQPSSADLFEINDTNNCFWRNASPHPPFDVFVSPVELTILVHPDTLSSINGYTTPPLPDAHTALLYKYDFADASKSEKKAKPPTKKIYASIQPSIHVLPFHAVLPVALRYAIGASVLESVEIRILSKYEISVSSALAEVTEYSLICSGNVTAERSRGDLNFPNYSTQLPFTEGTIFTSCSEPTENYVVDLFKKTKEGDSTHANSALPPLFLTPFRKNTTSSTASSTASSSAIISAPANTTNFAQLPPTPLQPSSPIQSDAVATLTAQYNSNLQVPTPTPTPTPILLLTGNEGSGKTHVALNLAVSLRLDTTIQFVNTIYVDCKQAQLGYPRMNELLNHFTTQAKAACSTAPSLLILDSLDFLAPFIDESDKATSPLLADQSNLIADHVCWLQDEINSGCLSASSSVRVLITAHSRSSLNDVLSSPDIHRIHDSSVNLSGYDRPERIEMLKRRMGSESANNLSSAAAFELSSKTESFLPEDLAKVVDRAAHYAKLRHLGRLEETASSADQRISAIDFDKALENFVPNSMKGAKLHSSDARWEDIGGLFETKAKLTNIFENPVKYKKIFANSPIKLPRGCLLYGPSGCGKTLLGGAIAKRCGLNLITVKGPELLNKYIGASEAAVRDLFQRAELASPCLLFFDEFESLAPKRGKDSTGVTDRVVNQLLTFLDGVETSVGQIFIVAATSRPDMIDPALLRPGRIDQRIEVSYPASEEEQVDVVKALIGKGGMRLAPGLVELMHAGSLLGGNEDENKDGDENENDIENERKKKDAVKKVGGTMLSPADISAILNSAFLEAVNEILAAAKLTNEKSDGNNENDDDSEDGKEVEITAGVDFSNIVVTKEHLINAISQARPSGRQEKEVKVDTGEQKVTLR